MSNIFAVTERAFTTEDGPTVDSPEGGMPLLMVSRRLGTSALGMWAPLSHTSIGSPLKLGRLSASNGRLRALLSTREKGGVDWNCGFPLKNEGVSGTSLYACEGAIGEDKKDVLATGERIHDVEGLDERR